MFISSGAVGVIAAAGDVAADELDVDLTMARLGVALAAGALVGLQRQFAKQDEQGDLFAGGRTFALIALLGGLAAVISELFGNALIFAVGLVLVGAIVSIGYYTGAHERGPGLTTEFAAIVTYFAGALAGIGELTIAVAVAVATTTLLALKPYTRAFVSRIDDDDVKATLQFAVLVALVLPLLPREPIGPSPFDAASPFNIGLMVVFILGLSFLGYVLIKVIGPRRGISLTGILGGLVSSTAVTLTMSERSKASVGLVRVLSGAVLLAWTIMYGRVLVEVGVVNAELLRDLWLPIGIGLAITGTWAVWIGLRRRSDVDGTHDQEFSNPFSLGPAIQFGLLYGVVLIGSKALSEWLGDAGVYAGAIASGVADVDAITLSMAELSRTGELEDEIAVNAIVLAAASNTIVKGGLVWALSTRAMRKLVVPAALGAATIPVIVTFVV